MRDGIVPTRSESRQPLYGQSFGVYMNCVNVSVGERKGGKERKRGIGSLCALPGEGKIELKRMSHTQRKVILRVQLTDGTFKDPARSRIRILREA